MKRLFILFITLTAIGMTGCSTIKDDDILNSGESSVEVSTSEGDEIDYFTDVGLGETIIVDDVIQFTFSSVEWQKKMTPSAEDYSNYFDSQEGKVYFIIKGTAKNLSGKTISLNYNSMSGVLFNDKYQYGTSFYEEKNNGKSFGVGEIEPLEEVSLYWCASVADEIKDTFTNASVQWGFSDLLTAPVDESECTSIFELKVDNTMINN